MTAVKNVNKNSRKNNNAVETGERTSSGEEKQHSTLSRITSKYTSLSLSPLNCSVSSFQTLLTVGSGSTIIHYSGHGTDNGHLLFEGPDGVAAPIKPKLLKVVFESGNREQDYDSDSSSIASDTKSTSSSTPLSSPYQNTQLVFVSACHSIHAGEAFVSAGVPHVVATTSPVRDESVIEFELQFYQALFSGMTIKMSFETARNSLEAANSHLGFQNKDEDLFVLLGEGPHAQTSLFSPRYKISSYSLTPTPQTLLINVPPGVPPLMYVGRSVDVHNVLHILSSDARMATVTGSRGVGKTTLVIRAVRYSAERMAHVRRVNYVSFPELKDYFEIQERKNRDRDMDIKGGFYSLKSLCKAISLQFESDLEGSLSIERGDKAEAKKSRSEDGEGFHASDFFNELTRTADDAGWKTTEFLDEGTSNVGGRVEQPPEQARRAASMPARSGYENNRYSSGELSDNKTLMVLDGIDTFLHRASPLFTPTLSLINELLRNPSIRILATSAVKLAPIIEEFKSINAKSEDKDLPSQLPLRRHHTSIAAFKDIVEKNVQLLPLDQYSSAIMLDKVMSRTLTLDEMTTSDIEGMDLQKVSTEQWFKSLSQRPALLRTKGNPLKIKNLALELDNKKMGELDEVPQDRPISERSRFEVIEGLVQMDISDRRCASLWVNCIKIFTRMNGSGTSPPNIGNLTELKKVVVSWECCETAIQHCIDRWTKATAVTCRRLTTREMRFIKSRMTSLSQVKNDLITFENFKKFCQWFSPSLTTLIRVSSEWQCVTPLLFHGFVGRHDAEVMLKGKDQGTFLIRLSESKPGSLAVSFNDVKTSSSGAKKIKQDHCAMSVNERGFTLFFARGQRMYDTLTDLVYECRKLVMLPDGMDKREAFRRVIANYATASEASSEGRRRRRRRGGDGRAP